MILQVCIRSSKHFFSSIFISKYFPVNFKYNFASVGALQFTFVNVGWTTNSSNALVLPERYWTLSWPRCCPNSVISRSWSASSLVSTVPWLLWLGDCSAFSCNSSGGKWSTKADWWVAVGFSIIIFSSSQCIHLQWPLCFMVSCDESHWLYTTWPSLLSG